MAEKCKVCGKEFDSERGLHIHQSQVHMEEEIEMGKKSGKEKTTKKTDRWKWIFGILVVLLLLSAVNLYTDGKLLGDRLDKEEAVDRAVNYIHENLKGGENVTLISSHETNSTLYRMKVRVGDQDVFNFYVTQDGKYVFFNSAKIE